MKVVDWSRSPKDMHRLLTWTDEALKDFYCNYPFYHNWDNIRRVRNKYKQELKRINNMEKPPEPDSRLGRLAELFERSGIDLDSVERIKEVSVYQGFYKDTDGEAQTVDLVSARYTPKNEMPDWLETAPIKITPTKTKRRATKDEIVMVAPDIQGGYRQHGDGLYVPTHDEQALDIFMQVLKDVQPDKLIMNGDNLDFPSLGKFGQESALQGTLNKTLNGVKQILAQMRANAPNTNIVYISGNHEERLRKFLMVHAAPLAELRVGGDGPKVMSVPYLLDLAGLDIEYVSGYPAGKYWINDGLKIIHGNIVRKRGGATAAAYLLEEDTSTIYGHVHRREYAERTHGSRHSGRYVVAASFGCLANIEGHVPSTHSGIDEEGYPERHVEDWQHGFGLVEVSKRSGHFALQQVRIETFDGYETKFGGKTYVPN